MTARRQKKNRGKKRNGQELVCEKRFKYRPEVTREMGKEKKANIKGRAKQKGNTRNEINGTSIYACGTVAMS